MDPNETLRLLRLTVKQMRVDENPDIRAAHADEVAEYVEALDEWLTEGGFLPHAWKAGRPDFKPGPNQPGSIGITDASGRMVWRFDYEHTHEYQGQKLTHSHDHHGPHGYFEHPEDVGAPVEPGYDTDTPYSRKQS